MARLLPKLVIHSSVLGVGGLFESGNWIFDDGQPFIIDPLYAMGDQMVDYGAFPNAIGEMYSFDSSGLTVRLPRFRRPKENEVVGLDPANRGSHGGSGNLRWDGTAWKEYRTLPQKALDAQGVFELFDVDGVYDYFAHLLGNLHVQHIEDTKEILNFLNPNQSPKEFLQYLAKSFGD